VEGSILRLVVPKSRRWVYRPPENKHESSTTLQAPNAHLTRKSEVR
jgi:hypothetical protein